MKYLLLIIPMLANATESDYVFIKFTQEPCALTEQTTLKKAVRINKDGTKNEGCYLDDGESKIVVFREGE